MKRLLFIAHRVPYPPDKGERVRAFEELKNLSRRFRVTLAALAHSDSDVHAASYLKPWCEKLLIARVRRLPSLVRGGVCLLRGRSVTEGAFRSRRLMNLIRTESLYNPFHLAMAYSSSTLPYLWQAQCCARVADLVDVDSAKWGSYAGRSGLLKRRLFRREQRGVALLEGRALETCQAVVLVSAAEAQLLDDPDGRVVAVGNGVDLDYFSPTPGPSREPSLVFTGTMSYEPNIDAVCWFVRHVWPGLRQEVPELTLTIVGRDPSARVRRLTDTPGVAITGAVPDVRPYLSRATAAIAPLRIARGIQNKVLEAMAMGRPVIGSPGALEGLEVTDDCEVLQANTPREWRDQVLRLVTNPSLRDHIGMLARLCVQEHYSWESRMAPLVSMCEAICRGESDWRVSAEGLADRREVGSGRMG